MGIVSAISNRAKILTDARYRHVYMQRSITGIPAREAAANKYTAKLPAYDVNPAAEETFKNLNTDGYAPLPNIISQEQISDLKEYFSKKLAYNPYRPEAKKFKAPENVPEGTHVAHFSNEDVVNAPHFLSIANNPAVISAVGQTLGAKPTISSMATWWSIAHGEAAQHAELFHRDVDDLRFIKMFIYLTDVDENSGPHVFVRGSQRVNKLTELRRLTDEEVAATFGAENILRFTGPAGTAFLENTYGIHRGVPPTKRPRLLMQVLYSLAEYIHGPKRPIAPYVATQNGVPLDPYVNRVYLKK